MHSLYENVKLETSLLPVLAAPTVSVNGASMDISGFRSPAVVFGIGNSGDTLSGTVYLTFSLEESADNSTFTAVAAADIKAIVDNTAGTVTTGSASYVANAPTLDSRFVTFEYAGSKRYVRGVVVATGTHTNGTPLSIVNALAAPAKAPVV